MSLSQPFTHDVGKTICRALLFELRYTNDIIFSIRLLELLEESFEIAEGLSTVT